MQPGAPLRDVARLCLLLSNCIDNIDSLAGEQALLKAWQEMGLRLQAATDQHAAMTEELEQLSHSDPATLTADQVWVLVRAVKVQSQVLQFYLGRNLIDA